MPFIKKAMLPDRDKDTKIGPFIFSVEIIFLLIMSLLRILLFLVFSRQEIISPRCSLLSFGVRFDLRYVGILGLFC